jgi:Reverse transcriptase-like
MLTGRLAKWAIILTEFDITYTPQKAIKGQALADFLAAHPIQDDSPLKCDFPDEETLHIEEGKPIWELYFDGASSIKPIAGPGVPTVRAGAGLVFVTPKGGIIRHSLALTEPCTNNEAEYEALIAGLELSLELEIKAVRICATLFRAPPHRRRAMGSAEEGHGDPSRACICWVSADSAV